MGEGLMPPCSKIVRGQQQLTPEQVAYASQFAQERIAAQLSTAAIDEQEVEEHLRAVYRVAGVGSPATIRWFDSPPPFLRKQGIVYAPPNQIVTHSMWKAVPVVPKIPQVRLIIGNAFRKNRAIAAVQSVGSYNIWGPRRCHIILQAYTYAYTCTLAIYRFFHEIFEENKLIHLACLNEMLSDYWLGNEEALLVRKPVILKCDERGKLHNANGPCLQYRDGWGIYAWHGRPIPVPEKVIKHPEQLTKKDWINESNVEVRRIIQQVLGPERFVKLVGGVCIDRGKRGNLIKVDLSWRDPEGVAHYVQVQDSSTKRQYYLRVPPSITSADEAIAWTFGMNARDYQPGQET